VAAFTLRSPFDDTPIERFRLDPCPLVRVLAQVRHPSLSLLAGEAGEKNVLDIAQRLSARYPIFGKANEAEFVLTDEGLQQRPGQLTNWRLTSADEQWQVTITAQFIALESKTYSGRDDFCSRLGELLNAYVAVVRPPSVVRVGLRYTNRLDDPDVLARLPELIRPEILGPSALTYPSHVRLEHSISQAQYSIGDQGLAVISGYLPPKGLLDPTLAAVERPSWLLDLDAFSTIRAEFDPDSLTESVRSLARHIYRYFRWTLSDQFMDEFGKPI
jgi:uncharacterized protein (TIGR04255 family)